MRAAVFISFALLTVFSSFSRAAEATSECEFIARRNLKELMRDLPDEMIGWANCHRHPEVGVFSIVRIAKAKDAKITELLFDHARRIVRDNSGSSILRQSRDATGIREIVIRTTRKNGAEPWLIYAFTAPAEKGSVILFVHALHEKETLTVHPTLELLRTRLISPEFLNLL